MFTVLLGETEERYIYTFATVTPLSRHYEYSGLGKYDRSELTQVFQMNVDGAGNVYVLEETEYRYGGMRQIRRIDTQGMITAIAGQTHASPREGNLAKMVGLYNVNDFAVDGAGNVYVTQGDYSPYSSPSRQYLRRIDTQGVITTLLDVEVVHNPVGVAVDAAGIVYVADSGNHRILRIDTQGIITTFAGTGSRGDRGDGGPATDAELNHPNDVAVDGAGNVYFTYLAGYNLYRIRRIDTQGVITTIRNVDIHASDWEDNHLTVDGAGNVYVADSDNHRILQIDTQGVITTFAGTGSEGYSGDGGPATDARLSDPHDVAVDAAGNVYFVDSFSLLDSNGNFEGRQRIRVVLAPGNRIHFTQEFPHFANGDSAVSDLVVVNLDDVNTVTPIVRFYGSNGERISADSVVDITGDLELAADGSLSVTGGIPPVGERTISTHGRGVLRSGSVRVVSDGNIAGFLRFNSMAVGVTGVGAAEPVNDAIFPARRKEGGINTGAAFRNLESDALTLTCRLMQGGEVRNSAKVELAGDGQRARFINELFPDVDTSDFSGSVRCTAPVDKTFAGVTLEMDIGKRIFTSLPLVPIVSPELLGDIEARYVYIFAGTGESGFTGEGVPATDARLSNPRGMAVDRAGNVYVADTGNHRIRRINTQGVISTFAGTGAFGFTGEGVPATEARFNRPEGVAVDGAGNVYVADTGNDRIRRINTQGVISTFAGTGASGFTGEGVPATEAAFNQPEGVAVDGAGNVYVADTGNHRIRRINTQGVISTFAGTGKNGFLGDDRAATTALLSRPQGVAVDRAGKVYVADTGNYRIRRIDTQGVISTFAGNGGDGFTGEGVPATEAGFNHPEGVAVDGAGNVYVADTGVITWGGRLRIDRIRRIDTRGVITTILRGPADMPVPGHDVAVDAAGNVYAATSNGQILVIRTPGERIVTKEFPQFANGDSTASDLVLVNVDTKRVTPVIRFYGPNGEPISADSLVEVTGDLELAADGSLSVTGGIPPLGERTIFTHGRGALRIGSVRVVSDGTIAGFLRFNSMVVGVAGVGAAEPVENAIFPARRKEGGINTGVALQNLYTGAIDLSCSLMVEGDVLKTETTRLDFRGQSARFINEMFPTTNTSNFSGSVYCAAEPRGATFTGVVLEMDIGNRIFTTLPLVPRTAEVRRIWKR